MIELTNDEKQLIVAALLHHQDGATFEEMETIKELAQQIENANALRVVGAVHKPSE